MLDPSICRVHNCIILTMTINENISLPLSYFHFFFYFMVSRASYIFFPPMILLVFLTIPNQQHSQHYHTVFFSHHAHKYSRNNQHPNHTDPQYHFLHYYDFRFYKLFDVEKSSWIHSPYLWSYYTHRWVLFHTDPLFTRVSSLAAIWLSCIQLHHCDSVIEHCFLSTWMLHYACTLG